MRTIQFKLSPDEVCLVEKILVMSDYADLTPKQLFMRFVRNRLEDVSKAEAIAIASTPKPKVRPTITRDGLERKEWIAARIKAYRFAEMIAIHDNPDHECKDDDHVRILAEGCWDSAVADEPMPMHFIARDGREYYIEFPPVGDD